MTYLLDTHILIWAFFEHSKLSERVKGILADRENEIFVSSVNFWEISIKYSTGKIRLGNILPEALPPICVETGFNILHLGDKEASTIHQLTTSHHKDPFDRMLIWQAMTYKYTLISDDEHVTKYSSEGLKVIW